jgi:hypothetical protein
MGLSATTASLALGWGNAREAAGRRLPPPRLLGVAASAENAPTVGFCGGAAPPARPRQPSLLDVANARDSSLRPALSGHAAAPPSAKMNSRTHHGQGVMHRPRRRPKGQCGLANTADAACTAFRFFMFRWQSLAALV